MKRILRAVISILVLTGCAHTDLKAPCADVASFAPGSVPCDQREPIGNKIIPSVFAQ